MDKGKRYSAEVLFASPAASLRYASNLFLCIFLLFAVRIVASLGAVCMRTEKNYVSEGEDPL